MENHLDWDFVGARTHGIDSGVYGGCVKVETEEYPVDGPPYICTMKHDFASPISITRFTHWVTWIKQAGISQQKLELELYTDASNYAVWDISATAQVTWQKKEADLSSPTSETGTLNLASISYVMYRYTDTYTPWSSGTFWVDHIYCYKDITSDVLAESYIETEMRNHHKAMIIAKGTWIPIEGDIIRITDYYTSASSTITTTTFEGIIDDYEQTHIRKIPCFSRAKRDLDEYRPKTSLSGDVDSEYLKTLIGSCAYITQGTIDATTPNTSYELKGDKTFRSIFNDWADKHKKMWALTPVGVSNFEDPDVDSGEDYDQSDKIWAVRPKKQVRKINKVLIYGALVDNVQLEATAVDQDSINEIGEILYKDTYAMISNQIELNTMATNLLAREAPTSLILSINFWNRHINKGLLQVGETITFAHSKTNPAITSQQMILRKIKYFFKKQISYFEVDSGLVFKKNKDKTLPQENSLLIQQNADAIEAVSGDFSLCFKTINCPSGTDPVADLVADTLNLVASGGLTITGNETTDTITFANTITQYTDALVEAVIDAEIVNGQSIDNAIDSLINTHNVADKHIAHSGVSIIAGTGLTGGGTIAANRTINCSITQYSDALARGAINDIFGSDGKADATIDLDKNKLDNVGVLTPIQIFVGETAGWYKLGTLTNVYGRVSVICHGVYYGEQNSGWAIAQFAVGNADNEFGGHFYTLGNPIDPSITFEWVDNGVLQMDCYVYLPLYWAGSIQLIEGHRFTLNTTVSTKLTDPSGTNLTEIWHLWSDAEINGNMLFGSGNTLSMALGTTINEFSIDGTLGGNSDDAVPTEQAVKTAIANATIATLTLDQCFDNGKIIDGATSEALAMQVGDADTKLLIWATTSPYLKASNGALVLKDTDLYIQYGRNLYIYNSANTRYFRLNHDGSNAKISTSFGSIYCEDNLHLRDGKYVLTWNADNSKYVYLYAEGSYGNIYSTDGFKIDATNIIYNARSGYAHYLRVNDAEILNLSSTAITVYKNIASSETQSLSIGSDLKRFNAIYYHTLVDKTCADFSDYTTEELYGLFKQIKPRKDKLLHNTINNPNYFNHIDFSTLPDEFSSVAKEKHSSFLPKLKDGIIKKKKYIKDDIEEDLYELVYNVGDKCNIDFSEMTYALKDLVVKMYEENQVQSDLIESLRLRIENLENN